MKTKGFKFLPEALDGKRTPQDLFDFYMNNWLDCDADPDFLEQAFELGIEGKDLPDDWYNMELTDMDYIEDINSIGQDINKRGISTVFAELRANAREDNNTDLLEDHDFDAMVEALEENEDLVECQECFDLFPKADCVKQTHGYVCPTCHSRVSIVDSEPELSQFALTNDLYTQEFPDITEYAPGTTKDWDAEPTVMDALDTLIKDEYDAIDAYEEADETIQHLPMDEDEKDDILDTIDHIKEEEEEHIDELKELADDKEVEETDEHDEDSKDEHDESSKDELHEENLVSQVYIVSDLETGEIIAACHAYSEEDAYTKLEPAYRERTGKLGSEQEDLEITIATETDLEMLSDEDFVLESLTEAEVDKIRNAAHKLGNKAKAGFRKFTKAKVNLNDIFTDGYILEVTPTKHQNLTVAGQKIHGNTASELTQAEKLAAAAAKAHRNTSGLKITLRAKNWDNLEYDDENIANFVKKQKGVLATYHGGEKTLNNIEPLNKELKSYELAKRDFEAAAEGSEEESSASDLDELRKSALSTLGEKRSTDSYTPESYKKYEEAFDAIVVDINKVASAEDFEKIDIEARRTSAEKLLVEKASGGSDISSDEDDIPEEDDLEDLKKKALEIFGEKKPADGYTEDSYAAYSKKFDTAIRFINRQTSTDEIKRYDYAKLKAKYEGLLKEAEEDLDIEEEDDIEAIKKAAIEALGEKEVADGYTEESYAEYSKKFENAIRYINRQTTRADLDKYDYAKLAAKYKGLLKKKEEDIPEEEDSVEESGSEVNLEGLIEKLTDRFFSELIPNTDQDRYTEDSWKSYDEATYEYAETVLKEIKSEEDYKSLDAGLTAKIEEFNKLLVLKPTDEDKEEPENSDEPEEGETEGESEGDNEEPFGFSGKLSELSDVQLARMYAALSGKGVGYADESKTKLSDKWHKEMSKLRRKLQGLGENFEMEDEILEYLREAIAEDLKSTDDAVAELEDTETKLKSAATGLKSMADAMKG